MVNMAAAVVVLTTLMLCSIGLTTMWVAVLAGVVGAGKEGTAGVVVVVLAGVMPRATGAAAAAEGLNVAGAVTVVGGVVAADGVVMVLVVGMVGMKAGVGGGELGCH
jgi:hypothetical protein